MDIREIECVIEGILFASGEPVSAERLCVALELDRKTVESILRELGDRYSFERRGIRLVRMDNSWQLASAPEYAEHIRRVLEARRPPVMTQPALEALAVIAYYQPTTRAYIDQVRGVDSSYTVGLLLERGLIEECGRLEVPGRPILYRTTKAFLRSFGLSTLDELPELPDISGEAEGQLLISDMAALAGEVSV